MSLRIIGSSCAAALLSLTVAAAGQTTTQTPTQSPVPNGTQGTPTTTTQSRTAGSDQQVMVTGCLMRENTSATAGARDTTANGLVLMHAMLSPRPGSTTGAVPGSSPSDSPSSRAQGTAGTSGTSGVNGSGSAASANNDMTYTLAGSREAELAKYVGQRVEITGTVARHTDRDSGIDTRPSGTPGAATGTTSSGTTAPEGNSSSSGATGTTGTGGTGTQSSAGAHPSAEAQNLTVTSFRSVAGTCQ